MRKIKILFLTTLALMLLAPDAAAQCPMCKVAVESAGEAGNQAARGLNNGILYLLAAPYLLIGSLAFLWWRSQRKEPGEKHEPKTFELN